MRIALFNAIAFLSAFLLFQIELIIAKIFLPYYGGGYYVWGACVVFFQAMLLCGYVFSYFFVKKWGIDRYRFIYPFLFFLPLLSFMSGLGLIQVHNGLPVVIDIFVHLVKQIGLAFFILSTVSVSLQAWLMHAQSLKPKQVYSLYAASNLGSLLGLLSYPFFFEIHFDLFEQIYFWKMGYFVLVALIVVLWSAVKTQSSSRAAVAADKQVKVEKIEVINWLMLGAVGTIMFLSVTNIVTHEIAPIPLFWVIPLSIYLVSFILSFKTKPFAPVWLKRNISFLAGLGVLIYLVGDISVVWSFFIYCMYLFFICIYAGNELYRRRPQNENDLPFFYVMISLGSFLGGVLVSWVMPLVSTTFSEFIVGLFLLTVILWLETRRNSLRDYLLRLMAFMWVLMFQGSHVWLAVINFFVLFFLWRLMDKKPKLIFNICLLVLLLALAFPQLQMFINGKGPIFKQRNYYGILRVVNTAKVRFFVHGATIHGGQFLDPRRNKDPVTYYGPKTPVWEVMTDGHWPYQSVGIIGLGVGSLAAFLTPGQFVDFYELDPDVYKVAQKYFTFLKETPARAKYIFGDARLSLIQSHERYDLFVVDAFGSDAVPVHLLTLEALQQYHRHLKEGGLILFNFSNRYLNLGPVIAQNSINERAYALVKRNPPDPKNFITSSFWAALTWDAKKYAWLRERGWQDLTFDPSTAQRPWTDSFSNILPYIQWRSPLTDLKALQESF